MMRTHFRAVLADDPQSSSLFRRADARRLHLIRHGQAAQQLIAGEHPETTCLCAIPRPPGSPNPCPYLAPALADAALTPLGHQQVRGKGRGLAAQVVLASPLTRALETVGACFGAAPPPLVVMEDLRARVGPHQHTRRRATAVLRAAFPDADFTNVPPDETRWGGPQETREDFDARAWQALCTIMGRRERHLAVVTHFTILFAWLRPPSDHRLLGANANRAPSDPAFLDGTCGADPEAVARFLAPGEVRTLVVAPA